MRMSKAQKEVISEMKRGLFIWTNEGRDFKAWLGNEMGQKVRGIKVRTLEILYDRGEVTLLNEKYPSGRYKYGLKTKQRVRKERENGKRKNKL